MVLGEIRRQKVLLVGLLGTLLIIVAVALNIGDRNDDNAMTLVKWLSVLHLDHIFNNLKELGVEEIEDMTLLDEEDFNSLNLKKIQMKKLKRAINTIE